MKYSLYSQNSFALMYPVADGRNIYPDGAASLHSVLIFEALKINIGFNDNPPAETNVSIHSE